MQRIIVGSEALAAGTVTRQVLRTKYVKLHHNVYAPVGLTLDARDRAFAAWLWSRGEAMLVGHSAAAMHGTKWLPLDAPAELARIRHAAPRGIIVHNDTIRADEMCVRGSVDCTTPTRTAYDIGRRVTGDRAIIRLDALLNATRFRFQRSSRSPVATPVRAASGNCGPPWNWSTAARSRRKRRGFDCYSSGPAFRDR